MRKPALKTIKRLKITLEDTGVEFLDTGITDSKKAWEVCKSIFPVDLEHKEAFVVLYLNNKFKLMGVHTVSISTTEICHASAHEILRGAILTNTHRIILCHNHPSGDIKPSHQDDKFTKHLVEICKTLEVEIQDHLIITKTNHYSYANDDKL